MIDAACYNFIMFIDNLNLNHLRIFECVYRTRSMTLASQELHLTQSGVSQHIKAFEDALGIKLFDRVKQRLIPTTAAGTLFQKCHDGLFGIESALAELKGGERLLKGTVSIGMPIEFGNNLIMPLLAEFSRKHPHVRFELELGFASLMNEMIVKGDLDFAFIDDFVMDRTITTEKVYEETLELCMNSDAVKKKGTVKNNKSYFESLDYVEYQENEPVLRMWFHHHLGTRSLTLNVKAQVMDVQGVAKLIKSGMGAGVLPGYLVSKFEKEGYDLYRFKGCGKPLKNPLRVAYIRERTHSLAARSALEFLKQGLPKGFGAPGGE